MKMLVVASLVALLGGSIGAWAQSPGETKQPTLREKWASMTPEQKAAAKARWEAKTPAEKAEAKRRFAAQHPQAAARMAERQKDAASAPAR